MELLIVLGVFALAVGLARWLVTRHLDRERIRRRLEKI